MKGQHGYAALQQAGLVGNEPGFPAMPHLLVEAFRNGISAGWQLPQLSHPLYNEREREMGAVSTGAPMLLRESERMEVLGADSQMLPCPWMLLMCLGFLMFLCHQQPFLLAQEI